jgi:5'-nucleotidase
VLLRALALVASLPLLAAPLALLPTASASPDGTGLVVNEVYGGGGNSGATYTHDFVELHNPTGTAVPLDGLGLQYRSTSGGSGGVLALSGTVPAEGHFLVQLARGSGGTTALPSPDQTGSLALSGSGGQVLLLPSTSPYAGPSANIAGSTAVVDMVGWGAATTFETAPAPGTSNSTSVSRVAGADTDSNAADLATGGPSPTPSGATQEPEPVPEPGDVPISDIQGIGAASPMVGRQVTTRGVVTAVYPGRLNGFHLQTGGTGGATDATPGASDGLFVHGRRVDESTLDLGDSIEVTGEVSEFHGSTQVTAETVTRLAEPLPPVTPLASAYPTTEADREAHEGELLAPTDTFTVTNTYPTNQYAEIGLATGDRPLLQPTDVARPGTPAYDAVVADNVARAVTLDDGSSTNFLSGSDRDTPLPWLTPDNAIRVGAEATLHQPVVLQWRNSTWKLQPQRQVVDDGSHVATFEDTRAENAAPQPVGGDLRLATFNVLNYFTTTGEDFETAGGQCSYYTDRNRTPITVNRCTPDGPRGAADWTNLQRQEAKIVRAINGLGADIVSLEELENSAKMLGETDRDVAIRQLVNALNEEAGAGTWRYVPSPVEALTPEALAQQDVIRTGFIYRARTVQPLGESDLLLDTAEFTQAREPLAQVFKPVGQPRSAAFAVVVNHFKSKGCSGATGDNADLGDGQACWNSDRVEQAQRLVAFADGFAAERGVEGIFLTGDFNSYTEEDPMHVLYDAGFGLVESGQAGDASYSFSGLSGSLDHVLANEAAARRVTGADVWEINANESIAFQYSRFNYNATQFHEADQFAASDHNPEIVGVRAATSTKENK